MFGGHVRMFPQALLWLSMGLPDTVKMVTNCATPAALPAALNRLLTADIHINSFHVQHLTVCR